MWVHRPGHFWPSFYWNGTIQSFVPAVNADDLASGGRSWVVMVGGTEVLVRETVEELVKKK